VRAEQLSCSRLFFPSLQSSTVVAVPAFGCRGSFQAVVVVVCFRKKISLLDRSKGRGRERGGGEELREASSWLK
jgi:hypothetical protein